MEDQGNLHMDRVSSPGEYLSFASQIFPFLPFEVPVSEVSFLFSLPAIRVSELLNHHPTIGLPRVPELLNHPRIGLPSLVPELLNYCPRIGLPELLNPLCFVECKLRSMRGMEIALRIIDSCLLKCVQRGQFFMPENNPALLQFACDLVSRET